jgi:hypothetical protein
MEPLVLDSLDRPPQIRALDSKSNSLVNLDCSVTVRGSRRVEHHCLLFSQQTIAAANRLPACFTRRPQSAAQPAGAVDFLLDTMLSKRRKALDQFEALSGEMEGLAIKERDFAPPAAKKPNVQFKGELIRSQERLKFWQCEYCQESYAERSLVAYLKPDNSWAFMDDKKYFDAIAKFLDDKDPTWVNQFLKREENRQACLFCCEKMRGEVYFNHDRKRPVPRFAKLRKRTQGFVSNSSREYMLAATEARAPSPPSTTAVGTGFSSHVRTTGSTVRRRKPSRWRRVKQHSVIPCGIGSVESAQSALDLVCWWPKAPLCLGVARDAGAGASTTSPSPAIQTPTTKIR